MPSIKVHRNSQKRFYGDDKIYFITTVTKERFSFFNEDLFCDLFVENLRICKELKKFKSYAFIIIPNHVHLLLRPNGEFNVSQIMQFLKRHFSRDMNFILNIGNEYNKGEIESDVCREGDIRECRLHGKHLIQKICRLNGGRYENFSGIINSHDDKLQQIKNKFTTKYGNPQFKIHKFKWQKSFYDHVIRNEKDFLKHLKYIAFNCVKHKICHNEEKYRWSNLNSEFANFIDDWQ